MAVCIHGHVTLHVQERHQPQVLLPRSLHLMFELGSQTGIWSLPAELDWLASEAQGAMFLHLPRAGIVSTCYHA